ncbi:MAG TPA: DNA polymerase III subunit beta [Bacteroidetes bacterium]|nr:DNA polymerase III subunit beta [Ignavibacteria bacterium]HCA43123.1 DNA polymerase III subunit beta [Bacteroidota bacterium]HCN36760.1 DNA polymerase III subunit beta [Bacteroidota bacterium]
MKFKTTAEEFINAINKLSSVIPTRSTLPILDNVLFELEGNKLVMLASDLEIFVRSSLEVEGKQDGRIAVDAKRLLNFVRTLKNEDLNIEEADGSKLIVKTKKSKFTFPCESADDFPLPEENDLDNKISIDGGLLKRFIGKVIHAVNTDAIRRNMSGVLFDIRKDQLRLVATDGFRLGKIIKENFDHPEIKDSKLVVPTKTCNLYLRLNENQPADLMFNDNTIKFVFGDAEIISKLIDDTFPNYESVIPKDNDKTLKTNSSDIQQSLKRAQIVADNITHRVKLEIKNDLLQIKADNPEIGAEGEESIDCTFVSNDKSGENFDEKPFSIAFNAGFLLECLSQIETEEVIMNFTTSSKAAIAVPTEQNENENFMELVMPVRIS